MSLKFNAFVTYDLRALPIYELITQTLAY